VRTRIGGFRLSEAFEPETADPTGIIEAVREIDKGVFEALGLPFFYVNEEQMVKMSHGQALKEINLDLPSAPAIAVFGKKNGKDKLVAVLEQKAAKWSYGHVFADP
jgi:hypothetical protein